MTATIIYMVAGLSSRFGGKIKQFAKVGPNNETVIEYAMNQAIKAGFTQIIFIVGEKTEQPFFEMFGNSYKNIPIQYAKQSFDTNTRDKPFGTVDALLSAKHLIKTPFVICNGDDIYGENALKLAKNAILENKNCIVGYKLSTVLPKQGTVNRGIIYTDENGVTDIQEKINISYESLAEHNLTLEDTANMNLFGFTVETLTVFTDKFTQFLKENWGSKTAECLLPVELGNAVKNNEIKLSLIPTDDNWYGVTNPEDEAILKEKLSQA